MLRNIALTATLALLAVSAVQPTTAHEVAAVGTMEYFFCAEADVVAFSAVDNGDGTWTFAFADIGNPACAWAETGAAIRAEGSPDDGFTGGVTSGPWSVAGDGSFTVDDLTVTLDLGSQISGSAAGQTVQA